MAYQCTPEQNNFAKTENVMKETVGLQQGADAPEFCLPSSDGKQLCLSELRGKWVVLYFYSKDGTSG